MPNSKKISAPEGYVSKGTFYAVAAACVVAGFFGGIVLSALKTVPNPPRPESAAPRQSEAPSGPSGEQMARIRVLEAETQKNPGKGKVWADLGNAYFDADQPEKAIHAYEKALEQMPDSADIITDMGVMYRRIGKPDKAIEAFEKAMKADPRHEISRYNKGIVLLHDLNNVEGAIKAWEDLIQVNPTYMTPTGQTVKQMVEIYKSRRTQESETPKKPS